MWNHEIVSLWNNLLINVERLSWGNWKNTQQQLQNMSALNMGDNKKYIKANLPLLILAI